MLATLQALHDSTLLARWYPVLQLTTLHLEPLTRVVAYVAVLDTLQALHDKTSLERLNPVLQLVA
jgi:hypothetical protein